MPNFGIDIDGVCIDWKHFVEWHNKIYGTQFAKKDFLSFDFHERFEISPTEVGRRVDKMYKTIGVRNLLPASGAVSGIRELSTIGESSVITARPKWAYEDTHFWLNANNFNRSLKGVYFSKNRHLSNGFNGLNNLPTKKDICLKYGMDYLIEDDIHYALPCAESGVKVLLFDYYGDELNKPNVFLVYSWREAVDKIKELERT